MDLPTQLFLGSISKQFDYVQSEEVSLKENVYDFPVNYSAIDNSEISNVHEYLMFNNNIKFGLIKQMFIALLGFSRSLTAKCKSLSNKPWVARPTLLGLNLIKIIFIHLWLV